MQIPDKSQKCGLPPGSFFTNPFFEPGEQNAAHFFPYFFLCIAGCGLYLADTMYLFWTLVNKPHTPIVSDPCFHLAVSLLFLFIVCITVLLVMAYTWLKPSIHFWPWWTNLTPHLFQILVFTLVFPYCFYLLYVLLVMASTWLKPSIHFWPWWTNITPHLQILVFTLLLGFSFMCVVWLTLEIKHVVYQANDKPKIYE